MGRWGKLPYLQPQDLNRTRRRDARKRSRRRWAESSTDRSGLQSQKPVRRLKSR